MTEVVVSGKVITPPIPAELLVDINELATLHETIRQRASANASP